jgi:phytoene desaturase
MQKAIIIGAGIAGLAAAVRLRLKGYEVTVLEANPYVGGKLSEFEIKGYRWDAGPSLFTRPQEVEELFRLAGKKPEDHFQYHRLPIVCRYFYEDGLVLNAWAEKERFAEEVEEKTGEKKTKVLKALERSEEIYDITSHVFLERSLHKLSTYLRKDTLISVLKLPRIDALRNMNSANEARFSDPRVVQLFNRYATYNGSNPYEAPATLNVIPHLEFNIGAFLPDKGMVEIPQSVYRLGQELGVTYRLGTRAKEIVLEGDKVKGVRVGEDLLAADLVVSNMDVVPTYRRLLPSLKAPENRLNQPRSSSALIFYWGINKEFPQLDLHNIFFSDDYEEEFRMIWKEEGLSDDPTVYVFISSKDLPSDAPPGCENWFVMINVPANTGQDWDALTRRARQNILDKLERLLGEAIEPHIEAEDVLDPRRIESRTSSFQGALYGTASNDRFAAFFRHPNFHSQVEGLYFVGGSVHPGGGIPLSLLSARILDDMLEPAG